MSNDIDFIDSPKHFELAAEHKQKIASLRKAKIKQAAKDHKPFINKNKITKGNHYTMKKLRPIAGFLFAPYLIIRPVIRVLARLGNWFFDQVFYSKAK